MKASRVLAVSSVVVGLSTFAWLGCLPDGSVENNPAAADAGAAPKKPVPPKDAEPESDGDTDGGDTDGGDADGGDPNGGDGGGTPPVDDAATDAPSDGG